MEQPTINNTTSTSPWDIEDREYLFQHAFDMSKDIFVKSCKEYSAKGEGLIVAYVDKNQNQGMLKCNYSLFSDTRTMEFVNNLLPNFKKNIDDIQNEHPDDEYYFIVFGLPNNSNPVDTNFTFRLFSIPCEY